MKKIFLLIGLLICFSTTFAQSKKEPSYKKVRHTAAVDDKSVNARQLSVRFTDGLKAHYSGNNKEAMEIFNGILLDDPKHDASHFMLAKVYKSENLLQDAALALKDAISIDKKNIWYKVELANLYMEMQDYAAAAKLFEEICKVKGNNEYYLYSLSYAYLNLEKYDKVIDVYNKMEKIIGYDDDLTQNKVALWLMMDKVQEAVNEYDKLIKMFPYDAGNYVKAGNICQSNGRMDKAMEYYNRATLIDPDNPDLNLTLALYWEQNNDSYRQMHYLKKYFSNSQANIETKLVCMKNCMKFAAENTNKKTIDEVELLATTFKTAHPDRAEGYAYLAATYVMVKKYEEAKTEFEKSFVYDKATYTTWQDYCYVLDKLAKPAEILKYEQDILDIFPTSDVLIAELGRGYLAAGNADKAIEYLKRAVSYTYTKSQLSGLYQSLGDAYHLKGDEVQAQKYWQKVKN